MRVLTGSVKGRKLKSVSGLKTRPTSGRVKKSIFDKLGDISGLRVLDLFAGTGSLGIEALSRGASNATFVEKDSQASKTIHENIVKCGFEDRSVVISRDYSKALPVLEIRGSKFELVFIDPPYDMYNTREPDDLINEISSLLRAPWTVVIEHEKQHDMSRIETYQETRSYGSTRISYFRNAS